MRGQRRGLTARGVETITEPGRHFDTGRLGLYLIVEQSGTKRWGQRITIRGKRCELGLGGFPVVTLAGARTAALDNLRAVHDGRDPLQEKRAAQAVLTFEEAARKVHEIHKPTWRNAKHADDFLNSLKAYAFPTIGSRKASEVTSADVLAVLTPIWTSKHETARRVRQRISTVMKWAVAQGWRQDNPAEAVATALPKVAKSQQHRKALPYSEVAICISAVQRSQAWTATKLAIEFLVLTLLRSIEVRGARWDEMDLHGAETIFAATQVTWNAPAVRMKTKKLHRVPLSSQAIEILRQSDALRDQSGLIFPSIRGKLLSDMTLSKLVKELGFDADVHGFRTSFRTWAQERTNFPREVAEAALAHEVGSAVERAYARSDVFEKRRRIMQAWADYLGEENGDLVPMKR